MEFNQTMVLCTLMLLLYLVVLTIILMMMLNEIIYILRKLRERR